jgi:hypothetical protein
MHIGRPIGRPSLQIGRPSLGGLMASLALLIVLGGSATAASHYLITSTSQIKPSVLKKLEGRAGTNGTPGSPGTPGVPGAPGVQGVQGPPGPSNLSGLTTVVGPTDDVAGTEKETGGIIGGAEAKCPEGSRAVSGGGYGGIAGLLASEMDASHLSWFIVVDNRTKITVKIHAAVECAAAGQAVAARTPRITSGLLKKRIAELEAEEETERSAGSRMGR